uniref:Uncharacterized protein n=1 Tax=Arundo donax TaxID=35708 RepID=A0A0A9DEH9_ARUDO
MHSTQKIKILPAKKHMQYNFSVAKVSVTHVLQS